MTGQTQIMSRRIRTRLRVEGIVQGVGFRPFLYGLATGLDLAGLVGNDVAGVFAEVEGDPAAIECFLQALRTQAPPLARIERITASPMPAQGATGFRIVASPPGGERRTPISADAATCDDCLAELFDPADRRYGYPFVNCVNCGPRFTIIKDLPYDREFTTMAAFTMCQSCAAEYHDPADRRFHAQPTCCPACGPSLWFTASPSTGTVSPVLAAAELLLGGGILAVKGLGGYHLAGDATSEAAAARLRARKHREAKPFAVMAASVAEADKFLEIDQAAESLLTSRARPIVLLPARSRSAIAPAVAPGNSRLGVMLPYTPLHHLLLRAVARPIILTSGNLPDEPIAYTDDEALDRLAGIADAFLGHDRAIHVRTDDSVLRPFRGRPVMIRRARGYAPEPLQVPVTFGRPVLACGAELKSTFCLAKADRAILSHHLGDLENVATLASFTAGIEHFTKLFDISPQVIAHDLHPEYLSTKYALGLAERDPALRLAGVQHHHAHIASCLADNGFAAGDVIGVAFDGTGYGPDGTIWGGEFLTGGLAAMERAGHLEPVPMPGGAAAIRHPWRMAAAYLDAAFPCGVPDLAVRRRHADRWDAVTALARRAVNAPLTSSAGRLFDAVAAIVGVRDSVSYEGQAAIELEQLAAAGCHGRYQVQVRDGDLLVLPGADLVRAVVEDLTAGTDREVIAARFHLTLADLITATCVTLREATGLGTVAMSGGVFQNQLLLELAVTGLEAAAFTVLTHSRVPCNDGGISLGQAVIAAVT